MQKQEDNESFASKIVSFFYLTGDYNGTQWAITGTICIWRKVREARYGAGVQNDKERPTVHGLTNNTVRYARRDIRKNSFAVRTVEPWMPDSIKQAESKEAFKRALKQLEK
jgi:hypothetical protein